MTRICNTPNCGRATPSSEQGYCRDCIGTVLRTGQPPRLVTIPAWRKHLVAKDMTGRLAA